MSFYKCCIRYICFIIITLVHLHELKNALLVFKQPCPAERPAHVPSNPQYSQADKMYDNCHLGKTETEYFSLVY